MLLWGRPFLFQPPPSLTERRINRLSHTEPVRARVNRVNPSIKDETQNYTTGTGPFGAVERGLFPE